MFHQPARETARVVAVRDSRGAYRGRRRPRFGAENQGRRLTAFNARPQHLYQPVGGSDKTWPGAGSAGLEGPPRPKKLLIPPVEGAPAACASAGHPPAPRPQLWPCVKWKWKPGLPDLRVIASHCAQRGPRAVCKMKGRPRSPRVAAMQHTLWAAGTLRQEHFLAIKLTSGYFRARFLSLRGYLIDKVHWPAQANAGLRLRRGRGLRLLLR